MDYTALLPPVCQSQLFTGILRERSNTRISEWPSLCARPITHQNSWGSRLSKCPFCGHCDPRLQNHPATWPSDTRAPRFPFLHAPRGEDSRTADGRAHVTERAVVPVAGVRRLHVQRVQRQRKAGEAECEAQASRAPPGGAHVDRTARVQE